MVTSLDQQKVCSDLLEWGRQHTPPMQLRCMAVTLDLTRLASEPDNLTLRRETMKRIAHLEEAVRTENTTSTLGYSSSGNDKPPRQQHEAEHRRPQIGRVASPVLAFVFGFLFIIYWNSTVANRSEPTITSSIGTVGLAPPPAGSGSFSWVTQTD